MKIASNRTGVGIDSILINDFPEDFYKRTKNQQEKTIIWVSFGASGEPFLNRFSSLSLSLSGQFGRSILAPVRIFQPLALSRNGRQLDNELRRKSATVNQKRAEQASD